LFEREFNVEGERNMIGKSTQVTPSIWQNTRSIVSTTKTRTLRPAHIEQPRPATKTQAEQEAERWVAQMMFDHYNG
jgi:hypothetical protein